MTAIWIAIVVLGVAVALVAQQAIVNSNNAHRLFCVYRALNKSRRKHRKEIDALQGEVMGEMEWVDMRPEWPSWFTDVKRKADKAD